MGFGDSMTEMAKLIAEPNYLNKKFCALLGLVFFRISKF